MIAKNTESGPSITCFNCGTQWALATATTSRCPSCGWIHEIYARQDDADKVAEIYNDQDPAIPQQSGVMPLEGLNGFSVSFPDQRRLAEVAERLLDIGL